MPSEKILEQKKQAVTDLAEKIKGSCAGVLVEYKGINVADDTKLRKELREAGISYSVVKNPALPRRERSRRRRPGSCFGGHHSSGGQRGGPCCCR